MSYRCVKCKTYPVEDDRGAFVPDSWIHSGWPDKNVSRMSGGALYQEFRSKVCGSCFQKFKRDRGDEVIEEESSERSFFSRVRRAFKNFGERNL